MLKRLHLGQRMTLAKLQKPLRLLVSIGLLALLISHTPAADLKARLLGLDPTLMVFALALMVLSNTLSALRWQSISNAWSPLLTRHNAIRHYFIGLTLNQVLPGATLSGDAYRASALQRLGLSWRHALTSVLLDRLSGLVLLLLLAGVGLASQGQSLHDRPSWLPIGTFAGLLTLLGSGVCLYYLQYCKRTARLPQHLHNVPLILVSFIVQIAALSSFMVALFATGTAPTLQIALLLPLVFIAAALPLSMAGWGTREMATIFCLGWAGVDASSALTASILCGVYALIQGLAALPLLLHSAYLKPTPSGEIS